ncbi:MAG TPA: sugar transferase [Reyranella sp.]|jgi:lipopolysaccharide/colanic/teichoic acid biosynthesis glycosyltransferase|nr:sugar transferase [Reyranella sp.]
MKRVKRIIDVAASASLLILLSPVFCIVAISVWMTMGRPILYAQDRVGASDRIFRLLKFRTMTGTRDKRGQLLPDKDRLTHFGIFLRRWSLDELPQLINVLQGSMSLVGPRPLLVRYLPRYSKQQRRRHEMRPGITGLAQINGRNALSWDERFALDVYYVDHWSLALDLKILFATFWRVAGGMGSGACGGAAADEFWGTQGPETKTLPPDASGPAR